MVEHIEEFRSELEQRSFRDAGVLVKCEIPLIESRSMEETSLGVAAGSSGGAALRRDRRRRGDRPCGGS